MNLEVDGTKQIVLVEDSQGLSLVTESKSVTLAVAGVSVQGPQGLKGDKGDTGLTGVVTASAPLIYNQSTRNISADTGTGQSQIILGDDYRLFNDRNPLDQSVTDVKINGTLNQSKITNLVSNLSTINTSLDNKAAINHAHTLNQITDAGTAAYKSVATSGDATSIQVVLGNDSRLSDTRNTKGSAGGDLTGTYPNPTIATGAITSAKILDGTIMNININSSAAIAQSKIAGLSTTFDGKQDVSAKNQANGYVGLNSSTKIDSQYLPVQNPTQYANVNSDSAFNIAAVSPYGSITWAVGDKIIKTGGTSPGTYIKFRTTNNNNTDWLLDAASGISQIETAFGGNKTGSSVPIGITDIGALSATATAGGDLTGAYPNPSLASISPAPTQASAGVYKTTVDVKGRVTSTAAAVASDVGALSSSDAKLTPQAQATASVRAISGTGTALTAAASDHTHTKADVGLDQVTNTSDANKPVSTAQATAIGAKLNKAFDNIDNVGNARTALGLGTAATRDVGTELTVGSTVASSTHPHIFRTSHNFIIQGNIIVSTSLPIPPFFAIPGWGGANSSGIGQTNSSMKLSEIHYVTASNTVNFQVYRIKNDNTTQVLYPLDAALGNDSAPTRIQASSTAAHLDSSNFTPIDIVERERIAIYITGIGSGAAPQNLTVTLVFEHRLN